MFLGDAMTDRQAQTGAMLFAGDKRLEHPVQNRLRDAAARIRHRDPTDAAAAIAEA